MNEETTEYVPWWKAKELSLIRKAAFAVQDASAKPGDSFLIVTEGTVSEPVYFELVRQSLQLSMVTVKIIPGWASDPRHVIISAAREVEQLAKRARKKRVGNDEVECFDHVWAVIDTDVAVRNGYWNDVVQLAQSKKVNLAHSTPCIEFWFLLHFVYTTRADLINGSTAKAAVRDAIGSEYSTNEAVARATLPDLIPKWSDAVLHARRVRQHHLEGGTPSPGNPSTEVDLLITALNDAAPAHQRKVLR